MASHKEITRDGAEMWIDLAPLLRIPHVSSLNRITVLIGRYRTYQHRKLQRKSPGLEYPMMEL